MIYSCLKTKSRKKMNIYFYKQKKRVLTNKILEKIHKKKLCPAPWCLNNLFKKKKKFMTKTRDAILM